MSTVDPFVILGGKRTAMAKDKTYTSSEIAERLADGLAGWTHADGNSGSFESVMDVSGFGATWISGSTPCWA